ncbi:serine/threonine-protein kinase [soil metagenome]
MTSEAPALEAILRSYFEDQDAGREPRRDEMLTLHPEFRDELTAFFETSDQVLDCKAWLVPTSPELTIAADAIPGYVIQEEIGRGGMGVVFKAVQPLLGRTVALKLLRVEDPGTMDRLLAEARAAARLDHPGIVPIFEVGDRNGRPFLAMAFVAGETLAARVSRGPLGGKEAAKIVRDVSMAVQHAHEQGIIHRDLKPANILLTADGQPKVTDFGLAKRSGEATLSADGQVLGTPAYMPPEFAAGEGTHAGPAADVYGLGAIFYALLTGRAPFTGHTPLETIRRVADDMPVPPRQLNPQVYRAAEAICLRCLEKQPRHRYDSAKALAEDLNRYLADEVPLAEQLGWRDWLGRKLDWAIDFNHARAWSRLLLTTAGLFLIVYLGFYFATLHTTNPDMIWLAFLLTLMLTTWLPIVIAARIPRLDAREREILFFWFGVSLGQVILFADHCPLRGEAVAGEVCRIFAASAVLYGVMFFTQGRLYWGRFYQLGLASFASALLLMNIGTWAPVIYGVCQCIIFSVIAFHLIRVARSKSRSL